MPFQVISKNKSQRKHGKDFSFQQLHHMKNMLKSLKLYCAFQISRNENWWYIVLHCSRGKMGKQGLNFDTYRKHWIFTCSEKSLWINISRIIFNFSSSHYTPSASILLCGPYCYACLWVSENNRNSSHCTCPSEVIISICIPLVSCLSLLEPIIFRTRRSFQKIFKSFSNSLHWAVNQYVQQVELTVQYK